jgi:putative DNA methylase
MLSTKPGREAYIEPSIKGDKYCFKVRLGRPRDIEEVKESLNKQLFTGNIHLLLAGETVANSAWS